MNFRPSISNKIQRENRNSNSNDDARCDHEVNFILEKPRTNETENEKKNFQEKFSKSNRFYFTPIRETSRTMILTNENSNEEKNCLDEIFLSTFNDFGTNSVGPPPGFEHFSFVESKTQRSSINDEQFDFSQLLTSNLLEDKINSSFSSNYDESNIFLSKSTENNSNKSSSSSSQIKSRNTSSLSLTGSTKSTMTSSLSNGLSSATNQRLNSSSSLNNSPSRSKSCQNENSPQNSVVKRNFFPRDSNDFDRKRSVHRPLSSSTSSSSSIDEALIQMAQQNNLFNNESTSIFNFPTSEKIDEEVEQRALVENLDYLAAISTPIPQNENFFNFNFSSGLNEICDRGFDELNTLIQEQRLIQSHFNMNFGPNQNSSNFHRSNSNSSKIFILPEYFIFKCQKVHTTASQIFEVLSVRRPELRLRDLMFTFQAWKESINQTDFMQKEEDSKLSLVIENQQNSTINESFLQSAFDRVGYALRQLTNRTQQARAAFQYATLNVFQNGSRTNGASSTRHHVSSP